MCSANKKHTVLERPKEAIILYVLQHCPITKLIGVLPQFVKLDEPVIVEPFNRCLNRLMGVGPMLAAQLAIEIGKAMCRYVLAVLVDQSAVLRTRFLDSLEQVLTVPEEFCLWCRQVHWDKRDVIALPISSCGGGLAVATGAVEIVFENGR